MKRVSEKGNVLWFILIGIVLLGALTLILSRSGSSVDQSADVEQLRVRASQILRYAKGLETAIEQMTTRGVSENDISFENTITTADYTNPHCTTDTSCLLFDPAGGGMTYLPAPAGTNDGSEWIFSGAHIVGSPSGPVGTYGLQTGNDLIMLLPNVNEALCRQINRDLHITSTDPLPFDYTPIDATPFAGVYDNADNRLDGDPAPFELDRKNAGCFYSEPADFNYFYYVLLAR
jgi:type II secretory pathway pseudopilin PulG